MARSGTRHVRPLVHANVDLRAYVWRVPHVLVVEVLGDAWSADRLERLLERLALVLDREGAVLVLVDTHRSFLQRLGRSSETTHESRKKNIKIAASMRNASNFGTVIYI